MKKRKSESKKLYSIDTEQDGKLKFYVNLASAFTGIVMFFIGCKIVPVKELYNVGGPSNFSWRSLVLLLMMAACLALYELIHIAALKLLTGESAETGFEKIYPYVGSKSAMDRTKYVMISLAPVVLIAAALILLLCVVPKSWFWIVYITFIMHVSGSVGDLYCVIRIISEKSGIKVKDNGRAVEIWLK